MPSTEKKVLLVEDDVLISGLLGRQFAGRFAISRAATGKEALASVVSSRPDLILLDIMLPDIDGFEVLCQLKNDKNTAAIPVVVLSNVSTEADIAKAKELGAVEFIVKISLTPEEIVASVERVLSH